ncbi:hypothetical protein CLV24_1403 [Pontibacter ummariensis]|uniref:EF-hand domain-containing protein n=1 Tax=Pontibacter ummariensis TaxID=1610492 RepID=A0A239LD80_9BACT|nr:hypothetical protein [Pontibacter ummariensis]PRY03627.1 hypothetical protein CLV24_1403 [Pontibacter ummariensis]SNT28607.1 hypothetical protein SAMN06296052_1403 [Pontibacter ummariensis]
MKDRSSLKVGRIWSFVLLALPLWSCNGPYANEEDAESLIADTRVVVVSLRDETRFHSTFGSANFYESWDASRNGLLGEQEFSRAFYSMWDLDNDNSLEKGEWKKSARDFRIENKLWVQWDTSDDGRLDKREFHLGFSDLLWYEKWDLNGDSRINESEYADGLFRLWDRDANGLLDAREYGLVSTYLENQRRKKGEKGLLL